MKTHLLFTRTLLPALFLTGTLATLTPRAFAQTTTKQAEAKTETATAEGFNATDKKLIMAASESDEAEITLARLALTKSSNPQVKEYAETMIKDHTKSTTMLKPIALAAGVTLPDLKEKHKAMAAKLEPLSGKEFDAAYLKGNVKSHKEILDTMKTSMPEISNPELKKFSATITPIIEHHLMMAEQMEKSV